MTTFRDIQMKDINGIIDSVLNMQNILEDLKINKQEIEYFEIFN